MSTMEFHETGSNVLDLLDSFPSSTAASSSPSLVAGATDERNISSEDLNQNLGISSSSSSTTAAIGLLGHDIGCDFQNHSSSSEQSSISASPGGGNNSFGFNQYNATQSATIPTSLMMTAATTKHAGASSSPSIQSSEADSPHISRASSKSNANVVVSSSHFSSPNAAALFGHQQQSESNKMMNRIMTPSSPLGDFRGYGLADDDDRNSPNEEDALWTGTSDGGIDCQYCHRPYRQPRLLFCLHSFCEDCIVAMLEGRPDDGPQNELDVELEPTKTIAAKPPPGVVRCPVCKQDSNVGNDLRFVQLLTLDYVTMNLQDANAMEQSQLSCESCKTKEAAVAHCFDCSSFLCPNCVKAHQFMRCFDNHKVLTFEQIKESGDGMMIHKPILCQEHPTDPLRYFCLSCKVPTCSKCMQSTHKAPEHVNEEVGTDMERRLREDLEQLVKEGKQKVQTCDGASRELDTKLSTVQERAEAAVQAVEDAYSTYLEVLDRRRDELKKEITKEHQRVEEEITNTFSRIGNMSDKINDALSFTDRLLRSGNTMEILHTRKAVRDQLTCLIRGIPSTNVAINLRFITDAQQFERAMKEHFGHVRTEVEPVPIEHVNVDELLKKINCANIKSPQSEMPPPHSSHGGSSGMMNPFGASGMGAGAFMSVGQSGRGGQTNMPNHFGDDPSAYNNFSRMMAGAVSGNTDFYGQANGHAMGILGIGGTTQSSNSASISPTSQISAMHQMPHANRSTSQSSPIDGGFGSSANGGNYRGGGHGMPNFSMPPPMSSMNTFTNSNMNQRRSPIGGGYDGSSGPLMGLPSMFGGVTVQTGMVGTSSSASGLTPPIRNGQMSQMQTKSRFGSLGPAQGQFNSPHGFCLNEVEEVAVADTNNHRVQVFSLSGDFRCQFGVAGKDEGQLWYPRKVTYLRSNGAVPGRYIVCDRGSERSRMQIFSRNGHFMKKIAIRYIDIVAGLAIDSEQRIVAVDSVTPTVFCIHENGELVRWFDCAEFMREPSDIAVSGHEYFICDFKGHCVCVFSDGGEYLRKIGCEGMTNFPNGIDISDAGDVLIGDSHGNRFHVAVYRKNGDLTCEFDCPYAKVSRCCGLRITRDGFVVTMAKNNHNVLVLNTLFVT